MSGAFLDRNKKKGLAASLLLSLGRHKGLLSLLLLVLAATAVFLSPASWMSGLSAGKRFAAGAARGDLLAAFRVAKTRSEGLGWSGLFGRGAPTAAAPNSLDFVKGRQSDLRRGSGAVIGIADPSDPRNKGGGAPLSEADLRAGREAAGLSGGAYASEESFRGAGGAVRAPDGLARGAVAALPPLSTPSSSRGHAAHGALSAGASRALEARSMKGVQGAGAIGINRAYTQLAEVNSRAQFGATACKPPACAAESAATNSGAIYDGNGVPAGLLGSSDPGGSGSIVPTVDVPADAGSADAQKMTACAALVQECASSRTAPLQREWADEAQLATWYGQMGGACGDPCHCGPCTDLQAKIAGLCGGDLAAQTASAAAPCAPLPSYCGALGFTTPSSASNATAQGYCGLAPVQCGCSGLFCGLSCLL